MVGIKGTSFQTRDHIIPLNFLQTTGAGNMAVSQILQGLYHSSDSWTCWVTPASLYFLTAGFQTSNSP